jgi:hypothetical protein
MTLQELKAEVLKHVSADWVRETYGKLTLKSTWQDAYDRLSEICVQVMPVVQAAGRAIVTAFYWFVVACCFVFHAGQAVAEWWATAPTTRARATADDWLAARQHPLLSSTLRIAQ